MYAICTMQIDFTVSLRFNLKAKGLVTFEFEYIFFHETSHIGGHLYRFAIHFRFINILLTCRLYPP